jgi:hypothetical protein
MALIIKELAAIVKKRGGIPFVFPAMGSHGGATSEGQTELINEYNINEKYIGAPVKATMEVVYIGDTEDGRLVYIDKYAAEADHIIVVNRIKAHTAFRGEYESGLMKMMVIGMGKQKGAEVTHDMGFGKMAENIPVFGRAILKHAKILLGIGLIENAYDKTCKIAVLTPEKIPAKEPELLKYAFSRMGRVKIHDIDVLVVDKIGKDISGDGMDPNITGRFPTPYGSGWLNVQRVAVLDLTDETHGNCFGVGMGDFTTKRLLQRSNLNYIYINMLTSTLIPATKIPPVMKNQREAIAACIKTCNLIDRNNPRIIRIENTLNLGEVMMSEALMPEIRKRDDMELSGEPFDLIFNRDGNLF